jgi:transcriptional regulator GlxA family with amidase domain
VTDLQRFVRLRRRWRAQSRFVRAAVHRAQDAVLENPSGNWTVETLAERAFVSSRHLRRLFTDNAGIAPLAYVQGARVALARALIAAEKLGVETAALRVGFTSARHLRNAWNGVAEDLPRDAKR